jgi:hypothetical protein
MDQPPEGVGFAVGLACFKILIALVGRDAYTARTLAHFRTASSRFAVPITFAP